MPDAVEDNSTYVIHESDEKTIYEDNITNIEATEDSDAA